MGFRDRPGFQYRLLRSKSPKFYLEKVEIRVSYRAHPKKLFSIVGRGFTKKDFKETLKDMFEA